MQKCCKVGTLLLPWMCEFCRKRIILTEVSSNQSTSVVAIFTVVVVVVVVVLTTTTTTTTINGEEVGSVACDMMFCVQYRNT
jgi:hypothetical protein